MTEKKQEPGTESNKGETNRYKFFSNIQCSMKRHFHAFFCSSTKRALSIFMPCQVIPSSFRLHYFSSLLLTPNYSYFQSCFLISNPVVLISNFFFFISDSTLFLPILLFFSLILLFNFSSLLLFFNLFTSSFNLSLILANSSSKTFLFTFLPS